MFNQTFETQDLAIIALLIVLEGVLSIDNALVLGLLAKRLPKERQKQALTYGLVGAFGFRLLAIATASYLLRWRIVKLFGGGYLLYISLKHFFFDSHEQNESPDRLPRTQGFWSTVFVIEMTDIAFAVDSILAAIALVGSAPAGNVGPHPKLWVVLVGGFLGLILMRFAAVMFIKLLEKFPRFETAAYLLVCLIGMKLLVDWLANTPADPHRIDFHSPSSVEFWVFWILMIACFSVGFIKPKQKRA
jgi:YkoY family integral membrane protein